MLCALSFPPRIKCGINSNGNPEVVFSLSTRCSINVFCYVLRIASFFLGTWYSVLCPASCVLDPRNSVLCTLYCFITRNSVLGTVFPVLRTILSSCQRGSRDFCPCCLVELTMILLALLSRNDSTNYKLNTYIQMIEY